MAVDVQVCLRGLTTCSPQIDPIPNGHVDSEPQQQPSALKRLPASFYTPFLSIEAKERKPSPSELMLH